MEGSQAAKNQCPFCETRFLSLGKHLRHCKKRDGRPYERYLSLATTRRPSKQKATTKPEQECPKCLKSFQRLDLHLRRSATCSPSACAGKIELANKSPQQQHSGSASCTQPTSSTPSINTFQLDDLPGLIPTTMTTQKCIKVLRSKIRRHGLK